MNPKVSIILPTWKESKYIERAIESVFAQTFIDWELIIIDDGLHDERFNEIKYFTGEDKRIILLKNKENLGIQKTLNIGLKEAKGEYIARIDDDDEWIDKNKLQKQVEFLDENKDYGLVGVSRIIVVNKQNEEIFKYELPENDKEIRNRILSKNCFIHSSVLFRASLVCKIGGYDESIYLKHIEDYDLWLKIGLESKFHNLSSLSIKYMLWKDSISSVNKFNQFKKNLKLIKNYKDKYPNYLYSIILNYFKIVAFNFFIIIPSNLKNNILKLYKEY